MNNYPKWWADTITIFVKRIAENREIFWHKYVVENCFWKYTGDKINVGETVLETNTTICRIPIQENFLNKYEWINKQNKSSYMTIGPGDIIVLGNVTETIDEYTSGKRSSDIISKYKQLQGCMVVDKVAIDTGVGKGNEHYYVKGV